MSVINPPSSTMVELKTIIGILRFRANSANRFLSLKNKRPPLQ
jgi:hypothetical protein